VEQPRQQQAPTGVRPRWRRRRRLSGPDHESGGAVRDTIDYSVKKIAPRVYAITLGGDLTKGEYGFLAPLDSTNNMASSGKIYTFALAP